LHAVGADRVPGARAAVVAVAVGGAVARLRPADLRTGVAHHFTRRSSQVKSKPHTSAETPHLTSLARAAAAVQHTTRAHTPDPQARGPRSLWTEVWPTQPMLTRINCESVALVADGAPCELDRARHGARGAPGELERAFPWRALVYESFWFEISSYQCVPA
jgi:hypothetical protein